MITWWIGQLALLGSLLALAALGAESALKVARRPTRWAWIGALVMTVALGIMAPSRIVGSPVPRSWETTSTGSGITAVVPSDAFDMLRAAWIDAGAVLSGGVQTMWSGWHRVVPASIGIWLLLGWAAASVTLLVAFAGVHWRYRRLRARWPQAVMHGTTVRIASDIGPAVVGVTSAEIVVPQWLLTRDEREQQLVVAHELEHVRVHDPLLLAVAQLAVVLVPWHPAVWWMAARLRLAVELDCDRRVLARGASARDYGTLLIDLTDHRTGFGAALPAFSCGPSHLERRLVAMTSKPLRYPLVRALSTGGLASLALLAACEAKLPTADEMDRMTASTATQAAGRLAFVTASDMRFFVDDKPTTAIIANAIVPDSIGSINVTKALDGSGEVRIVMRKAGDAPSSMRRRLGLDSTIVINGAPSASIGTTRTVFTGLMIVDGVITDPAAAASLSPDQIVSVDVIKGAAATAQYNDPRAANGVIRITTKKATP